MAVIISISLFIWLSITGTIAVISAVIATIICFHPSNWGDDRQFFHSVDVLHLPIIKPFFHDKTSSNVSIYPYLVFMSRRGAVTARTGP
jgi:hypothetical protein